MGDTLPHFLYPYMYCKHCYPSSSPQKYGTTVQYVDHIGIKYMVRKSQNRKIATLAEGPQIFKKIEDRKVADFRFAEPTVFADRPPLVLL